jgi:hypothetical protein
MVHECNKMINPQGLATATKQIENPQVRPSMHLVKFQGTSIYKVAMSSNH